MPEFVREERYIVVKRKHLSPAQEAGLRDYLADSSIGTVGCVVVEDHWPEQPFVWDMIKSRMGGDVFSAAYGPPRKMEDWDQRDEMVLLLVQFTAGATDDTEFAITIGCNNDHNVGEDEGEGWQFAGWCWTHDHFTEGQGTPIGWWPLPHKYALLIDPPTAEGTQP